MLFILVGENATRLIYQYILKPSANTSQLSTFPQIPKILASTSTPYKMPGNSIPANVLAFQALQILGKVETFNKPEN